MLFRLALQFAEQLPPVVRQELEQLLAAIQQQSNNIIPSSNLPTAYTILSEDPLVLTDNMWWIVREGVSPTLDISLKVRVSGQIVVLAQVRL